MWSAHPLHNCLPLSSIQPIPADLSAVLAEWSPLHEWQAAFLVWYRWRRRRGGTSHRSLSLGICGGSSVLHRQQGEANQTPFRGAADTHHQCERHCSITFMLHFVLVYKKILRNPQKSASPYRHFHTNNLHFNFISSKSWSDLKVPSEDIRPFMLLCGELWKKWNTYSTPWTSDAIFWLVLWFQKHHCCKPECPHCYEPTELTVSLFIFT